MVINLRMLIVLIVITVLANVVNAAPAPPNDEQTMLLVKDSFDKYLDGVAKVANTPGFAVVAVDNKGIVFRRTLGMASETDNSEMTSITLFPMLDISKGIFAAATALAVADGNLTWQDKAIKLWSDFAVADDYSKYNLHFDDLLSDRSGLPVLAAADQLWLGWSGQHAVQSLAEINNVALPRFEYAKQQVTWLAAGKVFAAAVGRNWDEYCLRQLFFPLNMQMTTADPLVFAGMDGWADGSILGYNEKTAVKINKQVNQQLSEMGPAGSVVSNLVDMASWLQWQLQIGQEVGKDTVTKPVVDLLPAAVKVLRQPMIDVSYDRQKGATYYSKGWFVAFRAPFNEYYIPADGYGFTHMVSFMPQGKTGIAVLSNMANSDLPRQIKETFYKLYFLRPQPQGVEDDKQARVRQCREIVEAALAQATETAHTEIAEADANERTLQTSFVKASDGQNACGEYENELYGRLSIVVEKGRLVAFLGPQKVKLCFTDYKDGLLTAFFAQAKIQPTGYFSLLEVHKSQDGVVDKVIVRKYASEGKAASEFARVIN